MRGEKGFERADSMLEGLGARSNASFLAKIYPRLSCYLIRKFLVVITELSIVAILGLFMTSRSEILREEPAVLLTEGIQSLRLGGLLTLTALTHGKMEELMTLTRYREYIRENVKQFYMKKSTASWSKTNVGFRTHFNPVPVTAKSVRHRRR